MAKEFRALNDSDTLLIVNRSEDGILIQSLEMAPWGTDHLGFTPVDETWLEKNTTPLPDNHEFVQLNK